MTPPPPATRLAAPGPGSNGPSAVLLDMDNLIIGTSSAGTPIPAAALAQVCRGLDTIAAVRRAYANWRDPRHHPYEAVLAGCGVDLIQLPALTTAGKNAADLRLAVDAMSTLTGHPEITTYILATGDADLSPLVQRLREHGKTVIGVGARRCASPHLVAVCTDYRYWPPPTTDQSPTPPSPPPEPAPAGAQTALAAAHQLLLHALDKHPTAIPNAAAVKNWMLDLDPTFDHAALGYRRFRAFLNTCPHLTVTEHPGRDATITRRR